MNIWMFYQKEYEDKKIKANWIGISIVIVARKMQWTRKFDFFNASKWLV